jgi:hypothetical protein
MARPIPRQAPTPRNSQAGMSIASSRAGSATTCLRKRRRPLRRRSSPLPQAYAAAARSGGTVTSERRFLIEARDGAVVWGGVGPEVDEHFIAIAPAPALGRVVSFDNRMVGFMKMGRRVAVRRGIATPDMPAYPTNPQMDPRAAHLEALFATARASLSCRGANSLCSWRFPPRTIARPAIPHATARML